jgi:hypothetical protein
MVYIYKAILLSNKKKLLIHTIQWKKPNTKEHIGWFHFNDVQESEKLICGDGNHSSQQQLPLRRKEEITELFSVNEILYIFDRHTC